MNTSRGVCVHVGYQGAPGAFSEQAIYECLDGVTAIGYETFDDLGRRVEAGHVELGMLPVENTLAGSVGASYDVLVTMALDVVAEVVLPVRHAVLGVEGATIGKLRRVISHPVALAQCKRFFVTNPHVEAVAVYDTAGAAGQVASMGDPTIAAIAAAGVADRYGLTVLTTGVEDRPDNQTRFFLVRRTGGPAPPLRSRSPADRLALVAEVPNKPGALANLLSPIADAGMNLSKIEGRPAPEPWSYHFVLEMDARGLDDIDALLKALNRVGRVRILGQFARANVVLDYAS